MAALIDQLTKDLDEEKRKNEIIRNVSLELGKISSLKEKLNNILELLDISFNLKHTMLLFPNKDKTVLNVFAIRGFEIEGIGAKVPYEQGIIGVVASKQRKLRVSRLSQYRRYARAYIKKEEQTKENISLPGLRDAESQVALPLMVNNELVAVLSAESKDLNFFSQKDEEFLMTLSQQIALSIQNSIVFEQLEERVQERTIELKKINATKDRLFSIIGHDLKSPVASLQSISELIQYYNDKGQQEKLVELGDKISSAAKNVNHLLDNLLNWALSQRNEIKYSPEKIRVYNLIEEVFQIYSDHIASKSIKFSQSTNKGTEIYADYNMVFSILRNVLSNAIKFTNPEGSVEILASEKDEMLKLTIKDSGVGISSENIKTLFALKEKKSTHGTTGEKGTGLGMVLIKEFMDFNKGYIKVESSQQTGTSVHLFFPK